jgi:hypothetical protein
VYFLFKSVATGKPHDPSSLGTFNRILADARVPEAIIWRKPDFIRGPRDLTETPDGPLWPVIDAAAICLRRRTGITLGASSGSILSCVAVIKGIFLWVTDGAGFFCSRENLDRRTTVR